MEEFVFFWTELVGGNTYRETIEAENFRTARSEFFKRHPEAHHLDSIINRTTGEKLL